MDNVEFMNWSLVFRVTEPEFARIRSYNVSAGPPGAFGPFIPSGTGYIGRQPNGAVIRVRGLPYSCKQNELINFFQGLFHMGQQNGFLVEKRDIL